MRRIKIVLGSAVLFLAISLAWAVGAAEVANVNLQEDIRDIAAQGATRMGVVAPSSDGDISNTVVRKAQEHGIALKPQQVMVRRTGSGETSTLYITAHYTVSVNCWLFSLNLRFTPSSDRSGI
jgi:type III secretion system FlhB-like substrate exporter